MRVLVLLAVGSLAGCAGGDPAGDRCFIVRSFSSQPLGHDFMTAEPVPVSLTDKGLKELLALAPTAANKYESFCAAVYSDGRLVLTPNLSLPKESFLFSREKERWKFEKVSEVSYLR